MNLPLEWLKEFVDADLSDIRDFCEKMTATGSKVEGYEEFGDKISNIVVARIDKISPHPDADKLRICSVDVGEENPIQIVTAATNVFEGELVPLAKAPAVIASGDKIKPVKMRGIESFGMFCGIEELGLTIHELPDAEEDGVYIFRCDCKPGDDVCDVLRIRDTAVEFEITPNRPDCLSVIGLAREVGATYKTDVKYHTPVVTEAAGDISDYISVAVNDSEKCPRYTARVVKNVKIAPSPLWMRMRLHAAGVRAINNIVDITNYVMLEYGQPMHAFDYSCLDGSKIVVRSASEGEKFTSLDSIDHTLSAGMLVIADEKKPVALAGVMGGENSEIKDTTETVVFESANFMGASVRITSRDLGMRTESSGRFEKGLDPEMTRPAVERACELVTLLGAGEVVSGEIDVYGGKRETTKIPLECDRINSLLGVKLDKSHMEEILKSLEFSVDNGIITVPSFRGDVECMNDIAEEVIRIYGYNKIESSAFTAGVKTGELPPRYRLRQRLNTLLCSLGYDEAKTFSFISPSFYDKIAMAENDSRRASVKIRNPLGEDTSVMRTTLLPSLLDALARNYSYHGKPCSLYETASVYIPADDSLPDEHTETVIASYGNGDFYRLKGTIETIAEKLGITVSFKPQIANSTYHPGRCAEVLCGDDIIAVFGQLHPSVAKAYGFASPVYAAEIKFEKLFALKNEKKLYKPLPKYPALTRDFSFVCEEELDCASVTEVIRRVGGKNIEDIELFDIYRGVQLSEGKKSVSFRVTLRASDRTLTDEEADKSVKKFLTVLENELGITLRA